MRKFIYYLIPASGDKLGKKEGTIIDLILDIPYLLNTPPQNRRKATGIIPPIHVLNEILSTGIDDGVMSGGCKWEPFQIDENEFKELVDRLLSHDSIYFKYIKPEAWVKSYDEWLAWKYELLHGIPSDEYLSLWKELMSANKGIKEAREKGDQESEKVLLQKSKAADRKLTSLMMKYVKYKNN